MKKVYCHYVENCTLPKTNFILTMLRWADCDYTVKFELTFTSDKSRYKERSKDYLLTHWIKYLASRMNLGNLPGLAGVRGRMVRRGFRCRHGCNAATSIKVFREVRRLWRAYNQRLLRLEEGHSHLLARLGSENTTQIHWTRIIRLSA